MSPTGSARGRSRVMPYGMDAFMLGIGMLGELLLIGTGRMQRRHEADLFCCCLKGHMMPRGELTDDVHCCCVGQLVAVWITLKSLQQLKKKRNNYCFNATLLYKYSRVLNFAPRVKIFSIIYLKLRRIYQSENKTTCGF